MTPPTRRSSLFGDGRLRSGAGRRRSGEAGSSWATPAGPAASSRPSSRRRRGSCVPAEPDDLFDDEPDELWSAVLRRQGGAYAVLALMPPDPSLN